MANKILSQSGKVGARRLDEYNKAIEEQLLWGGGFLWRDAGLEPYVPPVALNDQLARCAEFRKVPSLVPQIQGCGDE